jgi:hypothetical protein
MASLLQQQPQQEMKCGCWEKSVSQPARSGSPRLLSSGRTPVAWGLSHELAEFAARWSNRSNRVEKSISSSRKPDA